MTPAPVAGARRIGLALDLVAAGDVTAQLKMPVAPTIYLMAALTAVAATGLAARALQRRPGGLPG